MIGEAMGGLRYVTGTPDRPPSRVGVSIGDTLSALYGVIGAMFAIEARHRTGKGQVVDVALYESVFSVMESMLPEFDAFGVVRERTGSILPGIAPTSAYLCSDGSFVLIAGNGDSIFNDRPAFATDLSRPGVVKTRLGAFDTSPLPGQTLIPSNLATGTAKFTLNLRLVKAFALGSKEIKSPDASSSTQGKTGSIYKNAWQPLYAIRFELIVNNIFNHPNLATPIGNLSSPFFGKSIALAGSPFSTTAASRQIIFRTVFRF